MASQEKMKKNEEDANEFSETSEGPISNVNLRISEISIEIINDI